jgi:hypothetical protein
VTDHGRYATLVQRVADLTGVLRSRAVDAERIERNGAAADQRAQIQAGIKRLERVVRELEKATA